MFLFLVRGCYYFFHFSIFHVNFLIWPHWRFLNRCGHCVEVTQKRFNGRHMILLFPLNFRLVDVILTSFLPCPQSRHSFSSITPSVLSSLQSCHRRPVSFSVLFLFCHSFSPLIVLSSSVLSMSCHCPVILQICHYPSLQSCHFPPVIFRFQSCHCHLISPDVSFVIALSSHQPS